MLYTSYPLAYSSDVFCDIGPPVRYGCRLRDAPSLGARSTRARRMRATSRLPVARRTDGARMCLSTRTLALEHAPIYSTTAATRQRQQQLRGQHNQILTAVSVLLRVDLSLHKIRWTASGRTSGRASAIMGTLFGSATEPERRSSTRSGRRNPSRSLSAPCAPRLRSFAGRCEGEERDKVQIGRAHV